MFASPESGDSYETKTSFTGSDFEDKLPIGLSFVSTNNAIGFLAQFLTNTAEKIVKGDSTLDRQTSDEAGSWFDEVQVNFQGTLRCDSGYVMTGMKLKTLEGEEGKSITGVRIKCTKLLNKTTGNFEPSTLKIVP